jgi:hypothetical protein
MMAARTVEDPKNEVLQVKKTTTTADGNSNKNSKRTSQQQLLDKQVK